MMEPSSFSLTLLMAVSYTHLLLKIAEQEDRTVNLRHLMDFGKKPFTIKVLNTNQIVHSMEELILAAGEFV